MVRRSLQAACGAEGNGEDDPAAVSVGQPAVFARPRRPSEVDRGAYDGRANGGRFGDSGQPRSRQTAVSTCSAPTPCRRRIRATATAPGAFPSDATVSNTGCRRRGARLDLLGRGPGGRMRPCYVRGVTGVFLGGTDAVWHCCMKRSPVILTGDLPARVPSSVLRGPTSEPPGGRRSPFRPAAQTADRRSYGQDHAGSLNATVPCHVRSAGRSIERGRGHRRRCRSLGRSQAPLGQLATAPLIGQRSGGCDAPGTTSAATARLSLRPAGVGSATVAPTPGRPPGTTPALPATPARSYRPSPPRMGGW